MIATGKTLETALYHIVMYLNTDVLSIQVICSKYVPSRRARVCSLKYAGVGGIGGVGDVGGVGMTRSRYSPRIQATDLISPLGTARIN